ncbi:tRNA (adenine-N1)-methyltransferase [uncultured Desulfovibrio sp.]|uniref:tRNA (adenine-N1)-methyltransferase n=1 Tax=uncultured Desulfovibrio sp. TaxID=167968 RepID=UPI0026DD63AB|nr:tRNA (adenine-N1)-methyltransferase [uncultured Desulfovibrio sp.]
MIPYGSLVVFVTPKGRRYIKRLEEGRDWHSNDGTLPAAQVAALDFGSETSTTLGVPIRVLEATLFDRLQGIKRQTQIIYAKDIAYICLRLGSGPGRTIIEAGCGSGGLTVGFSWFCGPTGKVVSHDAREEFTRLARRNLDWAGVGGNVELHHRDVAEGFAVSGADALFLDVRTPWEYLKQAVEAVKPGASLGFLLPTVDQVGKLLLGLEQGPFAETEVCEILIRRWKPVADRLRPEDRMTAHTGFLVFCRQQECSVDFESRRPMGTRERKQEAARLARLGLTAPGADAMPDGDEA